MNARRLTMMLGLVFTVVAAGCATTGSVKETRQYIMTLHQWLKCQAVFVTPSRPLPADCPGGGEQGVPPPPPPLWPN